MTRNLNWLAALALVAFGVVTLYGAVTIGESFSGGNGHRLVPTSMSAAVLVLSALVLFSSGGLRTGEENIEATAFLMRVLPLMLLIAAYAWGQQLAGYLPATLVSAVLVFRLFNNSWLASLLHGLIGSAVLYALFFRLLALYDPPGSLFELTLPF